MRSPLLTLACVLLLALPALAAEDLKETLFVEIDARFERAKREQVPLLAPSAYDRAQRAYDAARTNFERGRALRNIRGQIDGANRHLDDGFAQAQLARVSLGAALAARVRAIDADARRHAPRTWENAERAFTRAIGTLEGGRSDRAQAQAAELASAFDAAELEAIQQRILGDLRRSLQGARESRLERLVPQTLAAAQSSHDQAEAALALDRYDTERPEALTRQGIEQAAHATHLAAVVNAVGNRETTLEAVLLGMEAPVIELAHALQVTPDLSHGITATAGEVLDGIRALQRALADAELTIEERNEAIASLQRALGGATQESLALNALLEEQSRRRARLERVETLFRGDEAQVLRIGNQLILRLVGLSFASGSAELRPEHQPLLAKALDAITTFPHPVVTIEGHTDTVGAADLNLRLSQQRAEAVRRHLLANSRLTEVQVAAMGFGDANPIATNDTSEGRARNRRIDIVIARVE
jgi:OmpA-OmpF porin, OOP family